MENIQRNKTKDSRGRQDPHDHLEFIHNKIIKLKELNIELKLHMNYDDKRIPNIFRESKRHSVK